MDAALRDLEQIREREDGGSRVGLLVVAGIAVVSMALAMGAFWGRSAGPPEIAVEDPLARLDRAAGLAVVPESEEAPSADPESNVDREALTFPDALVDDAPSGQIPSTSAEVTAENATLEDAPRVPVVSAALPAAVAAARSAVHRVHEDHLVREALDRPSPERTAAHGHDGRYTIQVISYDEVDEAEAFAGALRARGHRAFVLHANVEGRGRYYRVRIGPFETVREAEAYRATFEASEHMNSIVVRRPDEVRQSAE